MKRKKIIRYIVFTVLLLVAAAGIYIYREFNRTHTDTAKLSPDFSLPAASLVTEFETNEQVSNKKYWDKIIRVQGTVKEATRDDRGFYTVVLGDSTAMSSVRCSIDSVHSNEAAAIRKGQQLAVKGICSGFNKDEMLGSDVILVRSVIDQQNTNN